MYHVQCPGCQRKIKLIPALFGRKAGCKCGLVLRLPADPDGPVTNKEDSLEWLVYSCTSCKQKLKAATQSAGKFTRCTCGGKNQVPTPVSILPDHGPVVATLVPVESPFEDLLDDLNGFGHPIEDHFESAGPSPTASYPVHNSQNPYATPQAHYHINRTNRTSKTKQRVERISRR